MYIIEIIYHISYTRNNYSNICIVLGALKLLLCFSLDIDINDILNYRTNYLLRKKQSQIKDSLSTRLLVAIKTRLFFANCFLDNSTNHNLGPSRSLHFKFCQMTSCYEWFSIVRSVISHNSSKISAKLAISFKYNIIFANFFKCYWIIT